MNTLYLVRHGENPANITKEFSCRTVDYSLTPKGVLQARQTAAYFRDKSIHEIYASPLKRARETAEIIADALGLDVVVVEHFREVDVGALEGQLPTAELWARHDRVIDDWYGARPDAAFEGGEDYWALLARMKAGLRRILDRKHGRNVVIVGHGGIFTFTLKDICRNVDVEALRHGENHNCSITEIAIRSHAETLEAELRSWAACAHLSGSAAELISASFTE